MLDCTTLNLDFEFFSNLKLKITMMKKNMNEFAFWKKMLCSRGGGIGIGEVHHVTIFVAIHGLVTIMWARLVCLYVALGSWCCVMK